MTSKERRILKFKDCPVHLLSSTTRWYFKKWGIRKEEIRDFECRRDKSKLKPRVHIYIVKKELEITE